MRNGLNGLIYLLIGIYFLMKFLYNWNMLVFIIVCLIITYIIIGLILDDMFWLFIDQKERKERRAQYIANVKKEEEILRAEGCYIDGRGYKRDIKSKRLIHRTIAYKQIYNYNKYPERFGFYDVHHKDENKLNNSPENLEILSRKEHQLKHEWG